MSKDKISICYHPTTIALVDDDQGLLQKLYLHLNGYENLPCLTYKEPQKALQFLNTIYKPNPFINRCFSNATDSNIDHLMSDFNVRKIHEEIYNPNRFSEITNIVIDYAMPGINGLDFCRQIDSSLIKKVMLTGEAGKELAVEAFNEGCINKFIMKSTPNLVDVLTQNIKELQNKYFLQLSEIVFNKSAAKNFCFLTDPVFINFFTTLCQENKIIEHYLLDEHGSFLLLDMQAKPYWLIVKTDKELNNLYTYAAEEEAPAEIINAIKERRSVPYFHSEQDLQTPPHNWGKYIHPATELKSEAEIYYYSLLTDTDIYKLDKSKILSYHDYLEKL